MMIERRYQMTRVRAGVYLLPSNDGNTLWRLTAYVEDGSAAFVDLKTGEETPIRGIRWMAAKHSTPFRDIAPHLLGKTDDEFLYSDDWREWHACLRTRGDAIQAALQTSERDAAAA